MVIGGNKWVSVDDTQNTYANAKEITPVEGLVDSIADGLAERIETFLLTGLFIPGYASISYTDMYHNKINDDTYGFYVMIINFEFNGRERRLLNVPFALKIEQVGDNEYMLNDIVQYNKWRSDFSRGNERKCVLPDSKNAQGNNITKCLSNEGIDKVLAAAYEKLIGRFPDGKFNVMLKDAEAKLRKASLLDFDDDSELDIPQNDSSEFETDLFESRIKLNESDIRYLVNRVKRLIR